MEKKLPKNWVETDLMSLASVYTGKKDANYATDNGRYNFFTCAYNPLKSDNFSFEGDVLILPGNGINVGEVFYFSGKFEAYQRTYIVDDIKIDPKYLFYHFKCFWRSKGTSEQYGSATNYIKIGNFKSFKVQLPPLREQQRIVSKLDGLFAHLEEIENRIDNLEVIRVKFLQSCLQHDGNYYQRKKIGQYLEEGTARIGENWHAHRLIGVSAKNGIIDLKVGQKKSFEKYKIVRPGDFIYNTMRVNIGSIAIYNGSESALTSPDYVVFRVKHHVSPQLLLRFLKSDQGILEIGANTKGSVRARLYFKSLSEIRMPVAPVHVHTNAEKFLKQFNQGVEKLNQIANSTLKNLRQAILAKAFRGELTEQLDTDGDAAELLKEIQKLKKK